ncbi:hypothetical protein F4813DRAFT_396020 [Daldinia decipiens]|uniref:uncharacterized protein n=1 Tax=Daldinia decipiens TaxID=326647 RepID=UPI0020C41473|nr:uncharacterized protein F4813DRAFT_396020 [Daldinia decipiens]KAI1657853.1 hypothetical protein F4813DRAFT_396020 [Daldinia decipiens]
MATGLFVTPENAGEKRPREDDQYESRPAKRVRREHSGLFYAPSGRRTGYQPRPSIQRQAQPRTQPPSQEQSQEAVQPISPSQFFEKRENSEVSGRNSWVRVPSLDSQMYDSLPSINLRFPSVSSSTGTSSVSGSTGPISFHDILNDILRARSNLEDIIAGRRSTSEDLNPENLAAKLTRKNLRRHRKIERMRRDAAKSTPQPSVPPRRPIFKSVNWNRKASRPYKDDNVSPRRK